MYMAVTPKDRCVIRPAKRQKVPPPLIVVGTNGTHWHSEIEAQIQYAKLLEMVLEKLTGQVVVGEPYRYILLQKRLETSVPVEDVFEAIYALDRWRRNFKVANDKKGKITLNRTKRMLQCHRIVEDLKDVRSGRHTQCSKILDLYTRMIFKEKDMTSEDMPPRIALVNGPPGSGKTTLKNALKDICDISGTYCLSVTPWELQSSDVYHSRVHHKVLDVRFDSDSILIVNGIEALASWRLGFLSRVCQIVNTDSRLFGGCTVLLIGDLRQLRSGSDVLPDDLLRCVSELYLSEQQYIRPCTGQNRPLLGTNIVPRSCTSTGVDVLTSLRCYELTEQWCCRDPVHAALVRGMCTSEPVKLDRFRYLGYSLLEPSDVTKTEWMRAPVLVATEGASCRVKLLRAKVFALRTNQPVLRWFCDRKRPNWKNIPSEQCRVNAMHDPCFYEVFVQGADGYISGQYNKRLGLVRGIKIRYVSLLFADEHQPVLKNYLRRAKAGDVVTLPFPPLVILVEVFPPRWLDDDVKRALRSLSLGKEGLIIPIQPRNSRWRDPVAVQGGKDYEPSQVSVKPLFPLEPSFAMTIHEACGRTLRRVILVIAVGLHMRYNISYRQLYSVISHVTRRSRIRLLIVRDSEEQPWKALSSIGQLCPDRETEFYFAGFRRNNLSEQEQDWTSTTWSAGRANEWLQRKSSELTDGP